MGFGFNHFFYGPERWWNAFDLVIITTSVIETFLDCRVWVMPVSVFVDLILCFCWIFTRWAWMWLKQKKDATGTFSLAGPSDQDHGIQHSWFQSPSDHAFHAPCSCFAWCARDAFGALYWCLAIHRFCDHEPLGFVQQTREKHFPESWQTCSFLLSNKEGKAMEWMNESYLMRFKGPFVQVLISQVHFGRWFGHWFLGKNSSLVMIKYRKSPALEHEVLLVLLFYCFAVILAQLDAWLDAVLVNFKSYNNEVQYSIMVVFWWFMISNVFWS